MKLWKTTDAYEVKPLQKNEGRRRTTIFRPGLMSNLIIYYKLINYKCMDNIMKCTPLGEQKSLWLRKTLLIMKFFVLFLLLGTIRVGQVSLIHRMWRCLGYGNTTVHDVINAIEKKGDSILPIIWINQWSIEKYPLK